MLNVAYQRYYIGSKSDLNLHVAAMRPITYNKSSLIVRCRLLVKLYVSQSVRRMDDDSTVLGTT
jgi:hypothetical protein